MPLELHEKYREIRSSAKHRVQEQVQSMGWFTCPKHSPNRALHPVNSEAVAARIHFSTNLHRPRPSNISFTVCGLKYGIDSE